MDEGRLVKRVMLCELEGERGRGRPGKRWADGVKEIVQEIGLTWEGAMELAGDRGGWRELVGAGIERRKRVLGRISRDGG